MSTATADLGYSDRPDGLGLLGSEAGTLRVLPIPTSIRPSSASERDALQNRKAKAAWPGPVGASRASGQRVSHNLLRAGAFAHRSGAREGDRAADTIGLAAWLAL